MNVSATTYHRSAAWMEFVFQYEGELDRSNLVVKQVDISGDQDKLPESQSDWFYRPFLSGETVDFDNQHVMGFTMMRFDLMEYTLRVNPLLTFFNEQVGDIERRACDIEIKAQAYLDGSNAEWRDFGWRLTGNGGDWSGNRGNCVVDIATLDTNLLRVTVTVLD